MATTLARLPCPGCGLDKSPKFLGLTADGAFDADQQPRELELRLYTFAGRGRIRVERQALPANIAIGLRDMLRARLAQVEAELAAAGIEG